MAIIAPIVSTFDNKGLRQAEGAFSRFGRTVGAQLKNLATAAAGIGVALSAGAVKAISAASDLDEAISATRQIFGDAADSVLAFADDAATALGISKQEALDGALVFGTYGKAAGLAGDELSDFTNDFLGLASDLASFRNSSPEEVIEAIGAALRGESEPLRRYGVLLDDATLKAEALALGIYSGNGPLTQQQKILAAEAAIYKQTADAQGDFARTSDGLANSSRILRARLANVTAQIGTALLPIALSFSGFVLDKVIPAIESWADTFSEEGLLGVLRRLWEWLRENGPKIGEWALDLAGSLVGWIQENAGDAIDRLGEWLSALGTWITDTAYPYLQEKVPVWADALWEWVKTDGLDAIEKLGEWLASVGGWFVNDALPYLTGKAADWAGALWGWVQTDGLDAIEKLGEWLAALGTWFVDDAYPQLKEDATELVGALADWVATDATDTIKALGNWLSSVGTWFSEDAGPILSQKASSLVDAIWDWVTSTDFDDETSSKAGEAVEKFGTALVEELGTGLVDYALGMYNAVVDAFAGAFTTAGKRLASDLVSGLTGGDDGIIGLLAEWARKFTLQGGLESLFDWLFGGGDAPDSPPIPTPTAPSTGGGGGGFLRLAKGGIVTRPTFAMIGEGGESEAVIPLSRLGKMGGDTYNVTVNGAVDPVSTARQIRQILEQDQRRLGRLSVV